MKERQLKILEILNEKERISVKELAQELDISTVSIRKYLEQLESQGLLKRMHGYATKVSNDDISFRMASFYAEKQQIAKKAVELISPRETILVESGSTCALFALEAVRQKNATIITNSVFIANYLNQEAGANIIVLGGDYDVAAGVNTGPITRLCVQEFYVDKLFIGVDGYTEEAGFTNVNLTRCATVKDIAKQSANVIVLTTSDKFGKIGVSKLFSAEEVQIVVTDADIPLAIKESLTSKGTQVVTTF